MSKDIEKDPFDDGIDYQPLASDWVPNPKPIKGTTSKTKKKVSHNGRFRKHWEDQGYRVELLETVSYMGGKCDFCGCFDFLVLKVGETPMLIQVSSKEHVRKHWLKMLGNTPDPQGRPRRKNVEFYMNLGWKIAIQWFDQPTGKGGKWVTAVEYLDEQVIQSIDNGRRLRRLSNWEGQ